MILFCIDFDGVICHSLAECYLSSAHAIKKSVSLKSLNQDPLYKSFEAFRPFVRSGEDYVMIQHWLQQKISLPKNQQEFDRLRDESLSLQDGYKADLYRSRDDLLAHAKQTWLQANPLYPGWKEVLIRLIPDQSAQILSTKKTAYIYEILQYHGIDFPLERIHYATAKEKPVKMSILQKEYSAREVYLLDDQPDHLARLSEPGHHGILALWGYASPDAVWEPNWELSEALEYFTRDFPLPPGSKGN